MLEEKTDLQEEILKALLQKNATYAHPLNSEKISQILNINSSYARFQIGRLREYIGVRRGKHGGYYLKERKR
ncbi:MAG: Rrf2 family transcriptional regulator [Candidatus Omnitrophica bacterium]|nr:Rrf2 family transcriptional regulator [Candidatus Omnitrophota bacterium]